MSLKRLIPPLCAVVLAAPVFAAQVADPKSDDPELHAVCFVREPGPKAKANEARAAVRVVRPGKRVTLVLASDEPVTWTITATDATHLAKVVLMGEAKQTVDRLPDRVLLVETRPLEVSADSDADRWMHTRAFRNFADRAQEVTGLEFASVQTGRPADPDKPFVVDKVWSDPRLLFGYPAPEPAITFPKLEFQAVSMFAFPPPPQTRRFGPPPPRPAAFGKFTLPGGPVADSFQRLPVAVSRLVFDPTTKMGYGLNGRGVSEVDLENNRAKALALGAGLPPILLPTGIAFDTRRERVLIATFPVLYAYTPKTAKWEVVREYARDFGISGKVIAYEPTTDTIYVATASPLTAWTLYSLNAAGRTTGQKPIEGQIIHAIVGVGTNPAIQLLAVGESLILMFEESLRLTRGEVPETQIYELDPKTGKVRLAWKKRG